MIDLTDQDHQQLEVTLQYLHMKLKGSLMQLEDLMTKLDIRYKPINTAAQRF
jgi:hypothetical protein